MFKLLQFGFFRRRKDPNQERIDNLVKYAEALLIQIQLINAEAQLRLRIIQAHKKLLNEWYRVKMLQSYIPQQKGISNV